MSKVQVVSGFMTTDGKLFVDDRQAKLHQSRIDFIEWYADDRNTLLGNYQGSRVELHELMRWLDENHDRIMAYMLCCEAAEDKANA